MKKLSLLLTLAFTQTALFADDFSDGLKGGQNWLIETLAPIIVVCGVAYSGYCLAVGSKEGFQKGIFAVLGGLVIFASPSIVQMIQGW